MPELGKMNEALKVFEEMGASQSFTWEGVLFVLGEMNFSVDVLNHWCKDFFFGRDVFSFPKSTPKRQQILVHPKTLILVTSALPEMGEESQTLDPSGISKRKSALETATEVDGLKKQKLEGPRDPSVAKERGDPNGSANLIVQEHRDEEGGVPNGSADRKGKGVAIASSVVEDKGKGKAVVLDKGKAVMVEEEEDEDGSDDDRDDSDDSDDDGAIGHGGGEDSSDFDDDPLAELDLDNVLPSRTRRKEPPPPGSYLVNDLDDEDDDDEGFD